ncbi:MAG: Mrp/NBP35 family ATP-binding protein [Anaerolineales bacterium]|nr:Mrp/NBP35 family ATP-binding protein [Anaerolineales bacterium]
MIPHPSIKLKLPTVQRILTVASGKGGVGKTTVSVNVALALQQAGQRVGLFDADLYGPNVPLMLGVRRAAGAGKGFIPVARREHNAYVPPLERFGLKVMSIGLLVGEKDTLLPDSRFAGHIIRQTLQDVQWGELDYLLVDFPPGSGEPQQTLLKTIQFDGAVIVTTPQDLSLMDAGRSLGLFRQNGIPILGLVENMSYLICPHCGEQVEVFHRSRRDWAVEDQSVPLLGRVPMDIAISRGIDEGHPLMQDTPDAIQATAFREIAAQVLAYFNHA